MTFLGIGRVLLTINATSVVNPMSTDTSTRSALLGLSVRAPTIAPVTSWQLQDCNNDWTGADVGCGWPD